MEALPSKRTRKKNTVFVRLADLAASECRPIPSRSGYYADAEGRIWSRWRLNGRGLRDDDTIHLLNPRIDSCGYEAINTRRGNVCGSVLVSRLVCEAFHGPPPTPRHEAAHNDGIKANNRPSNLRWATHAENMADTVRHGVAVGHRGESNRNSKLTRDAVEDIRRIYRERRATQKQLSLRFGVCPSQISHIVTGRSRAEGD